MNRFLAVIIAALLLCGALASCGEAEVEDEVYIPIRTGNQVNYETVGAYVGTLLEKVSLVGTVTTPYSIDLSFTHLGGKIKELNVRQDMEVKAGEVIAVLDDTELEEEIVIQKIKLDSASSTYETLKKKGTAKEIEFARIDYEIEQMKYDNLVEQRDYLTIYAPFDGRITSMRNFRAGSRISQNQHLCTISDSSRVCLAAADYGNQLSNVSFGTCVEIEQGAIASTTGRVVDTIITEGVSYGGMGDWGGMGNGGGRGETYDVTSYIIQCDDEVEFSELGGITVTFTTLRREGAVIVPTNAIFEATDAANNTSSFVNVLMNGIKVQTPVTVGIVSGDRAEILSGLDGHETLILR